MIFPPAKYSLKNSLLHTWKSIHKNNDAGRGRANIRFNAGVLEQTTAFIIIVCGDIKIFQHQLIPSTISLKLAE